MTPFQWISVAVLSLLLIRSVRRCRVTGHRWMFGAQMLVWTGAIVAILWPQLPNQLALAIGIGRGTDLVLYIFCLAFIAISFALYGRTVRAERAIVELVSQMAIVGAVRHDPPGRGDSEDDRPPAPRAE
jgi:hypothetical protein